MTIEEAIDKANVPRAKYLGELKAAIDDEVRSALGTPTAAYAGRLRPTSIRGAGVILVSDDAIVAVDVGPKGSKKAILPIPEIDAVTPQMNALGTGEISTVRITKKDGRSTEVAVNEAEDFISEAAELANVGLHGGSKWWLAPTTRIPARPLTVDYLGGIPGVDKERKNVRLAMDVDGFHLSDPGAMFVWKHDIGWDKVREVAVEGSDQLQHRVTVTRLVAVGILAFGWKKKQRTAYVVFDLGDGEVIVASKKKTVHQLRSDLGSLISASAAPQDRPLGALASDQPSAADRLEELETLLKEGLITQEEFDSKRQAIIADI